MGGHLNLDGGALNLDGGTLIFNGGSVPPRSPYNLSTGFNQLSIGMQVIKLTRLSLAQGSSKPYCDSSNFSAASQAAVIKWCDLSSFHIMAETEHHKLHQSSLIRKKLVV